MNNNDPDPDWGERCHSCGSNSTHKYLDNEWLCFECVRTWPVDSEYQNILVPQTDENLATQKRKVEDLAREWSEKQNRGGWWDCGSLGILSVSHSYGGWTPLWFNKPSPAPPEWFND